MIVGGFAIMSIEFYKRKSDKGESAKISQIMKIYREGSLLQFFDKDFHDGPPKIMNPWLFLGFWLTLRHDEFLWTKVARRTSCFGGVSKSSD